jgi:hypothetical protein
MKGGSYPYFNFDNLRATSLLSCFTFFLEKKSNKKFKKRTMLLPTGSSGPAVLFSPALRTPQQGAASVQWNCLRRMSFPPSVFEKNNPLLMT